MLCFMFYTRHCIILYGIFCTQMSIAHGVLVRVVGHIGDWMLLILCV